MRGVPLEKASMIFPRHSPDSSNALPAPGSSLLLEMRRHRPGHLPAVESKRSNYFAVLSIRRRPDYLHLALLLSSTQRWVHLEEHWLNVEATLDGALPSFQSTWPTLLRVLQGAEYWCSPQGSTTRNELGRLLLRTGHAPLALPFVGDRLADVVGEHRKATNVKEEMLNMAASQRRACSNS